MNFFNQSLPTDPPVVPSRSVGSWGGDGILGRGVAVLDTQVQFMQHCEVCCDPCDPEDQEIFLAGWECSSGLLGVCLGCGDERIAGFSRVTAEVG